MAHCKRDLLKRKQYSVNQTTHCPILQPPRSINTTIHPPYSPTQQNHPKCLIQLPASPPKPPKTNQHNNASQTTRSASFPPPTTANAAQKSWKPKNAKLVTAVPALTLPPISAPPIPPPAILVLRRSQLRKSLRKMRGRSCFLSTMRTMRTIHQQRRRR